MPSQPLYMRLYENLLTSIGAGEYAPGARLPTDQELAAANHVSVITVRQALSLLKGRGLIDRWPRRGTFVSKDLVRRIGRDLSGFAPEIERDWERMQVKVLQVDRVVAEGWMTEALGLLGPSQQLSHVRRLRIVAGTPTLCADHYLKERYDLQDLADSGRWLFFRSYLMEKHQILAARSTSTLQAVAATEEMADLLGTPVDAPLLYVRRVYFGFNGDPLECHAVYARTERWSYHVDARLSGEETASY